MDTATSRRQFTIHRIPNFNDFGFQFCNSNNFALCSKSEVDKCFKKPWISRKLFTQWIFYAIVLPPFLLTLKKKIVNQLEWFILNQEPLPGLHHWQNIVLWKKKNQIKKYIKKLVWIDLKKHDKNIKVMVMTLSFCCSYYIL